MLYIVYITVCIQTDKIKYIRQNEGLQFPHECWYQDISNSLFFFTPAKVETNRAFRHVVRCSYLFASSNCDWLK